MMSSELEYTEQPAKPQQMKRGGGGKGEGEDAPGKPLTGTQQQQWVLIPANRREEPQQSMPCARCSCVKVHVKACRHDTRLACTNK